MKYFINHEKRHVDVFLETPPPLRNVTHFFRLCRDPWLSVAYKSMKVYLGQCQDLIMSIKIYLKYKYTYENAGFCVLCIDDFKMLKTFNKLSKFSAIFHRETSQATTPHPPNDHMTFLVDKIDIWRFPNSVHNVFYETFAAFGCPKVACSRDGTRDFCYSLITGE